VIKTTFVVVHSTIWASSRQICKKNMNTMETMN